jgi:predicted DNA binding CopG/RHH family protein
MPGKKISDAEYYDKHGILGEITDEDVSISLDDDLREAILHKKRKRNLKNISIKMDPLFIVAIKKIATKKGIPYQTLLRQWIAEDIKDELKIA